MSIPWSKFRKWLPILVVVVSLPPVLVGVVAVESNTADVARWLPGDKPAKKAYDQFLKQFGSDDFLVVSWPGCTLEDPRVPRLATALDRFTCEDSEAAPLFRRIITGPALLDQLTSRPTALERPEALERLEGIVIGSDHSTTCVVVEMSEVGSTNQQHVVDTVAAAALEECKLDREILRLGGSVYEAVEIDRASNESLDEFVILSFLVSVVLAVWCLQTVRLTTIVLSTAVYCHCLSIALVHFTRGSLNAVLIVMPTLIFVLVMSGAIHLVNYYRDSLQAQDHDDPVREALRLGWLPCVLAAGSTAFGLSSLGVSQIAPVRDFGLYSAFTLIVSTVVLLTFLPALLSLWRLGSERSGRGRPHPLDSEPSGPKQRLWIAAWIVRHERWVTFVCLAVVVFFAVGLTRISSTIKFERMFRPDSEIVRNYIWLEDHLGPTVPIEVVVRIEGRSKLTMLERVELLSKMQAEIEKIPEAGGVISAATFSPSLPKRGTLGAAVRRRIFDERLQNRVDEFVRDGFLALDGENQFWRVTAKIPALHEADYGDFVVKVRHRVESALASEDKEQLKAIEVTYTGLSPMIHEAQQQLLEDLAKSFVTAFLLISPVMMLILRGITAGLTAMIPNVVPTLVVFGGMGWMGIPVDIGAVLCASAALGIAVDDTLHFLTWYRRGIREGLTPPDAVCYAYRRCAAAMVQTTLICGFGILVFSLSAFVPTSQFAWLMFVLLWGALLGDLILLPALLAGPLSKLFSRSEVGDKESVVQVGRLLE